MKRHRLMHAFLAILLAVTLFVSMSGTPAAGIPEASAKSTVSRLNVKGNHLVNEKGKTVMLRGVSTHGLAWYPQYVNKAAFKRLKKDWGANVIRLALYTEEYGGYCSGGDKKALRKMIDNGVKYAEELGMYVIIDWHILSDNSPMRHKKAAKDFFRKMAKRYKKKKNVIFEICNEPHGVSWHNTIKPYAQAVTKEIRKYNKNAIIIVGTNTWSQDVDEVIGDRLEDKNTMYSVHFYAATHKEWNREKMVRALDAGVPVFVTECSISEASGSGAIDKASGREWMKLLKKYHVSYVAWSLSNKDETSALIKPSCQKTSGWSKKQLSTAGKWFRAKMRAQAKK